MMMTNQNGQRDPAEAYDVVIVGGGQGGASAAIALRQNGFGGSIAILGGESDPPYGRPPLSKEYLLGKQSFEQILFRPRSFWDDQGIALHLGAVVREVDHGRRTVITESGSAVQFGKLVWAAGGTPVRLPCDGADLAGVHSVRTRKDVDQMIQELPATRRVVVIGAGYIGLEAAAALRTLGKEVVVLEALDRVLARVAGVDLSRFFEREHRRNGVDLRLGQKVDCIVGEAKRVVGVRLDGGEVIQADMVVVGIGIRPNVDALVHAGAESGNGVRVDEQCRTSLADVFAVGDCAEHKNDFAGGALVRLESVQNANDQAIVAAKTIAGIPARYDSVPWFWSNQFDLRLQTAGISSGHDRAIVRGDPDSRSFSVVYLQGERMIAIDAVNNTRDYAQGRALVVARASLDLTVVAAPGIALRDAVLVP